MLTNNAHLLYAKDNSKGFSPVHLILTVALAKVPVPCSPILQMGKLRQRTKVAQGRTANRLPQVGFETCRHNHYAYCLKMCSETRGIIPNAHINSTNILS